jgi:hypothetical protein
MDGFDIPLVVSCFSFPLLLAFSSVVAIVVDVSFQGLSIILFLAVFQGARYALSKGWIR